MASRWQRIKKYLLKFDLVGPEYILENNDSSRFQSSQGLVWTIIAFMICLGVSYMFGKEIYLRKSPNVSISKEFISYSDIWVKEFPIMFSFISTNGTSLTAENFHSYFVPYIYFISMNNNGRVQNKDKYFDFESCNPDHYTKYSDLVREKMNNKPNINYLCMKHDDYSMFSNSYFAVNSTNLNFKIKKCIDSKNPICTRDENDLKNTVEDILITITYVNSFVDFYNFHNPVKTYLDELTTQVSLYLTRRTYFRVVYNAFESDNGILLEEKIRREFIYLDSIVPDDLLLKYQGDNSDVLFWLALESPKLRNLTTREYMKIQDLIAKLGGLSNAIIVICRILTYHYLRYLYLFSLSDCAEESIYHNKLEQKILSSLKYRAQSFNYKDTKNFNLLRPLSLCHSNPEIRSKVAKNQILTEDIKNEERYNENKSNINDKKENANKDCVNSRNSCNNENKLNNNSKGINFSVNDCLKNNFINFNRNNKISNYSISDNIINKNTDDIEDDSLKNMNSENNTLQQSRLKSFKLLEAKNIKENNSNLCNPELIKIKKIKQIQNIIKNKEDLHKNKLNTSQNKEEINIKDNSNQCKDNYNFNIINSNNRKPKEIINISTYYNGNNSNNDHLASYIPEKVKEVLKSYNDRKYFFNPSTIKNLIVNNKSGLSYYEYCKASICCNQALKSKYSIYMKAIRRVISIHTYSKLVISQYNTKNSDFIQQYV